jgi:glycosyltransferase involved in cell wall biosynthesis
MTVSIIVPNYNHARYLEKRLDTIFNQSYTDYEVILLDDCSTDDSSRLLEQYRSHPKVSQIVYNSENSGTSYKQWYKGIELAKGELIWIAESDDWCSVEFLATLVPFFEDKKVAIAFVNSFWVTAENESLEEVVGNDFTIYEENQFVVNELSLRNRIFNASMALFRKSKYDQVKDLGFQKMKLCGDWLLWMQIAANAKVAHVPYKLNYCRRHTQATTNKFRSLGMDFIEGVQVLKAARIICSRQFDYKKVYYSYYDYLKEIKKEFKEGIYLKILWVFLIKEPGLFFYITYKKSRTRIKKIIKFCLPGLSLNNFL